MKKRIVKLSSNLFPSVITSFAYKMLTNPQVQKLRENELVTLDKAEKVKYKFKDFDIQLYTWKGGDKNVFFIHGWEGQAGNFSDLIEEFLVQGYTVYAFDAPSHGFSSKGKTSMLDFTDLVGELIEKYNVKNLVSHSFGGVATTYALFKNNDIHIDKYILLTTPDKFSQRLDDVSDKVGINKKVKNRLIKRIESELEMNINILNVSTFVKSINVKKSLIIHDKNDKVIPVSQSKNVHDNWSESEFEEIEGTGHFRILRTKEVIDRVIEYFK